MTGGFHPVASATDLAPHHVFQAIVLGQDLALWRDDAGRVNAWENRCPHRGVRLSIGVNRGDALMCRYHGWHWQSVTGACGHIPAHPDQPIPASLCVRHFSVAEHGGLVFVALEDGDTALPALPAAPIGLRALPFALSADALADLLAGEEDFRRLAPLHLVAPLAEATVDVLIQPCGPARAVLHAVAGGGADARSLRHRFATRMEACRRRWEAAA